MRGRTGDMCGIWRATAVQMVNVMNPTVLLMPALVANAPAAQTQLSSIQSRLFSESSSPLSPTWQPPLPVFPARPSRRPPSSRTPPTCYSYQTRRCCAFGSAVLRRVSQTSASGCLARRPGQAPGLRRRRSRLLPTAAARTLSCSGRPRLAISGCSTRRKMPATRTEP